MLQQRIGLVLHPLTALPGLAVYEEGLVDSNIYFVYRGAVNLITATRRCSVAVASTQETVPSPPTNEANGSFGRANSRRSKRHSMLTVNTVFHVAAAAAKWRTSVAKKNRGAAAVAAAAAAAAARDDDDATPVDANASLQHVDSSDLETKQGIRRSRTVRVEHVEPPVRLPSVRTRSLSGSTSPPMTDGVASPPSDQQVHHFAKVQQRVSGSQRAALSGSHSEIHAAHAVAGEHFGESVLRAGTSTAGHVRLETARTTCSSELFYVSAGDFRAALSYIPIGEQESIVAGMTESRTTESVISLFD